MRRGGGSAAAGDMRRVANLELFHEKVEARLGELRKFKAASVWTGDVELLARVAAEQKSAKGNFPGPCPVVFNGNSADLEAAAAAGAGAVVLGAGDQDKAESASKLGLDVIWAIDSAEEAGPLVDAGLGGTFLLKSSEALDLVGLLPKVRQGHDLRDDDACMMECAQS